jgi:alkanesulfonate monooxygenase SsuD/methylene tetrahydromethanopterin reductase-like flavin-dependent oxidoreductase (luciferase family)
MQIGIGLPAPIPGVPGELLIEWAKKAEESSFSSLGIIDRLVYPNYEPLITLAAAAAVTRRIGLMTTILIAPLHNTAMLAKQAATLDALSNGRLSLGLAVGGREDDYQGARVNFHERGKLFDYQLETMTKIWAGEGVEGVDPIGPAPKRAGGPEILIGGSNPTALERVGRWGNGFISGGGGPEAGKKNFEVAEKAWKAAGRSGKPRFVSGMYFALGPDAAERASAYLHHYYGFLGPLADRIAGSLPTTPEALKGAIGAFEAVGLDELILWPCIGELDQLDRVAELLKS